MKTKPLDKRTRNAILKEFYSITFPVLVDARFSLSEIASLYGLTKQHVYLIVKASKGRTLKK